MQPNPEPPEITVDVSIPYPAWNGDERRPSAMATRAVREAVICARLPEHLAGAKSLEISVLLANDDLVRTLNREYRAKDSPTNVLSFPQTDSTGGAHPGQPGQPVNIGDIVLGFETVLGESMEKIIPFDSHFTHLVVHGTLHLLGYDHENEEDATLMEDTEIWIMHRMGYKNPYSW